MTYLDSAYCDIMACLDSAYNHFIPQNSATVGARRIAIYNEDGNRVGQMPLGAFDPPNPAKKVYSFGALSDVHAVLSTGADDSKKALTYLNETEAVESICICGDLTQNATAPSLRSMILPSKVVILWPPLLI